MNILLDGHISRVFERVLPERNFKVTKWYNLRRFRLALQ